MRRDQAIRGLAIERVLAGLGGSHRYRATSKIVMHVPSSTATDCPCCGNPWAKIDDISPDLDLFIDTKTKWRACRHQIANPRDWDEQAEQADTVVELPIRVSEVSMPLVLDTEHQIILASGGSRSSKTQTGVYWSLRQWMIRGGWGKIASFIGFEVEQAHILKDKFCIGEGDENPAVCDPELIVAYPQKLRSVDQNIYMVDGTRIRLQHTKGDGGNIAGRSYIFAQWTETAKTKHKGNYAQVRGRIVSSRGQMYLDAVPEAAHWLEPAVVEPAQEEQERRTEAIEKGLPPPPSTIKIESLAGKDNPWNSPAQAAALIRDLERLDPRIAARYGEGRWVGDANKAFGEYYNKARHTFELEAWSIGHLGMADVTGAASETWFYHQHEWICGVDVNATPHTTVMCKIGVPMQLLGPVDAGRLTYRQRQVALTPENWHLVCFDYMQVDKKDSDEAARLLARLHSGRFKGAGVIIDASSCYSRHNAGGALNKRKNITPRVSYEDMGFEVMPPAKTRKNSEPTNPSRFDSAIVLRRLLRHDRLHFNNFRCRRLIKAVRDHDAEPDGVTPVRATNTSMDRHIICGTDVLRYVAWPFLRLDEEKFTPGGVKVHG